MKILRLSTDGFGPLKGTFDFSGDRMVVLVDDNERGKSSLLAAITAALYGLDADKRSHRVLTPLERWRPWAGGAFRVELEVDMGEERYSIRRDFEAGSVEVWNSRGQDVTEEFRHGRDEYRVGRKLLGLDVYEFEKCALVRQGELDQVVPGDERARRASTLHARIENAADTHVGDTNATEAVQVLEGALRRYNCGELDTTGTVDNAIKALEAKHALLEADLAALQHDLAQVSGPADDLAALADQERAAREEIAKLDAERHAALSSDVRRQIRLDQEQRAALAKLCDEARSLEAASHLPANAEAELRETVARYEEAQRNLETLEARKRDELARERGTLESESASLQAYASCENGDADRFVALAAEIRRIAEEEQRLKSETFSFRDTLAGKGFEPERIQFLMSRFGALPEDQQRLMRNQSGIALTFQTEVAGLEQSRTGSTETLRAIDAERNAQRMPGWFLVALGVGAMLAGVVILLIHGALPAWVTLLTAGALGLGIGAALQMTAANARAADREAALRALSDAQRRLNQLRSQRAESEVALTELSARFNYRDPVELMREWTEYARLVEEFGPMLRPGEQMGALHESRRKVLEEVRALLDKVGGGQPDPGHLEYVAAGIRRHHAARQRLSELERSWSWIDEEKRVHDASATGLKERAVRMLQSAGLTYDPERSWADHFEEFASRARDRARHATLTEQMIPQAESQLRGEGEIAALRSQLAMIEAEGSATPDPGASRSPIEIERESQTHRDALERIQKRRSDLRLQIDETTRRYHAEHPEKQNQKERVEQTLARARRFKSSVELARETIQKVALDTHRRWAEHLNQRVIELLKGVGTRVVELRFGEDLDFSVRFWNGQPVARGKAVLQLSSGARDQLHFAVRLAVAEYLSRGQAPLPLLIDDAFATSDDERTRAGMKLLLEHFSKRHQVLMMTCHRKRFETLAAEDPELYGERVQWLDLRSAHVTG
ncbi:MAG: AAA family ATPase [Candidatus Eisenbacteria bacterium]|nr:AAA family ATPase [Candidatus Eisenbacteria bacterium]